jgi:hypothetical protein
MAHVTLDLHDRYIEYEGAVPPVGTVMRFHGIPEEKLESESLEPEYEHVDRDYLVERVADWHMVRDKDKNWKERVTLKCREI